MTEEEKQSLLKKIQQAFGDFDLTDGVRVFDARQANL